MKSNKIYLYLGLFAVLLIAAYFLTTDRGEKTASYKLEENKLFELDSVQVDKIEIKNKDGNLVLSKSTGEWRIVEPFDYRVNTPMVEKIVSGLKNLKLESIVSTNPGKKDTYGFKDLEQAEITVHEAGVQKGKFLLGGTSSGTATFVKKLDSDNIYIAANVDKMDFIKPTLDEWRDKNIISIPKQSVNSLEYISTAESFLVNKDSTGKFFIGPDSAGTNLDGILNLLEKLESQSFKDTAISEQTNFDNVVKIDWGPKTELRFLKLNTTPVKYLLQVSDDKQIYEVDEGYAKNLLKTKKEILGK